jgi:hypothetical protein
MVRYTLLRLLIFFGCLLFFWLVGLRRPDQQVYLLIASALASVGLSYVLLRREREQFSAKIAERVERRTQARQSATVSDEDAEDAEDANDVEDVGDAKLDERRRDKP